jgi:hypothetical protein
MAQSSKGARLLRSWLDSQKIPAYKFGPEVGVVPRVCYRWLSGLTPKLASAFALEELTRGFVPAKSWIEPQNSEETAQK